VRASLTEYEFQPLDLAACYGADLTARAISYGTASPQKGSADFYPNIESNPALR